MDKEELISGRGRKKAEHDLLEKRTSVRFTLAERNKLEHNAKSAGLSLSDYIRSRALGNPIEKKSPDFKKLSFEVNKIGVNLNQLVRQMNTMKISVSNTEIEMRLTAVYDQLSKVLDSK